MTRRQRARTRRRHLPTEQNGEAQMTVAVVSYEPAKTEFAAEKPAGFRLSKPEMLFFQCVVDALHAHGIRRPARSGVPKDVGRVIDYDHVKLLMARRMLAGADSSPEGIERHRAKVKTALKRARVALMTFSIIGVDGNFIWYTGKPVRGFDLLPVRRSAVKC